MVCNHNNKNNNWFFLTVSICTNIHYVHDNTSLGENGCTMNVHLLKHMPACVANWGPLWVYSCFHFESVNGHLKAHFHGTRAMNYQVCIQ